MSSLRRSARASRHADQPNGSPEPAAPASTPSPTKSERRRRQADEAQVPTPVVNGRSTRSAEARAARGMSMEEAPAGSPDASVATPEWAPESEPDKGDGKPTPNELSRDLRELLGLPGSSASTRLSPDLDADASADAGDELALSHDDAAKLSAVIQQLSPQLLQPSKSKKGKTRSTAGFALPFSSLQEALQPDTPLRDLRQYVCSVRDPLVHLYKRAQLAKPATSSSSASTKDSTKDAYKLQVFTLLLSLIDQLASELRHADPKTEAFRGQMHASSIEERATALEDIDLEVGPVQKKAPLSDEDAQSLLHRYALHMRLPKGDYFSRAIQIETGKVAAIDSGLADLVRIAPQSTAHVRALKRGGLIPPPTLGSRMLRANTRVKDSKGKNERAQGLLKPVAFLNYGNYASFAPTYDSSNSTLSHTTSRLLWQNSAHARLAERLVWGPEAFERAEEHESLWRKAEAQPSPFTAPGELDDPMSNDDAIMADIDADIDAEAFRSSVAQLQQDEIITDHLRFNMMLLHRLQEFQWARLRESYIPGETAHPGDDNTPEPSSEERATASLLLDSLGALVALQPRAFDPQSNVISKAVPDAATMQAFSSTSGAIDPELAGDSDNGYWGTLDEAVVRSKPAGADTSVLLHDNMAIRLTEETAIKAKKASRRGIHGIAVEDHGRGTLERFASTRTYDHRKDRHDVEPRGSHTGDRQSAPHKPSSSGVAHQADAYSGAARVPAAPAQGGMHPPPQTPQRGPAGNASYAFSGPGSGTSPAYGYNTRSLPVPVPTHGQHSPGKQQQPYSGQVRTPSGTPRAQGTPTHGAPPLSANRYSPYPLPQRR